MAGRNGQTMVGAYVETDLAERFKAWARAAEGGASAQLRRLIIEAMDGRPPPPPPGRAMGQSVMVRLKEEERVALMYAADARSTTPANWVRSLAIVHLARRPQWTPGEIDAMRDIFTELRAIGNNVNQIARAMNVAALSGEYPPNQGEAAKEAAELVRAEMRRIAAVMTGNYDYWGLPDQERPTTARGALKRDREATKQEERRIRLRPRRRPKRFREDDPHE